MSHANDAAWTKIPEITAAFWVMKILATTLGEVGGNALTTTLGLGYTLGVIVFAILLLVAVMAQIRAVRFHSPLYWTVMTATALTGTALADFFDQVHGFGYLGSSLSLLAMVIGSLGLWYWSERNLAVANVTTPQIEGCYWLTITCLQTLSTSLGDWLADSTLLGYDGSAIAIGIALAVTAGLYLATRTSRTALFWAAFILTRPFGATLADWLGKPEARGGLGINDLTVTAVLTALMLTAVALVRQRPRQSPRIDYPYKRNTLRYRMLRDSEVDPTLAAGTIVYELRRYDYACAASDELILGVECLSVTRRPDGGYPFVVVPVSDLELLGEALSPANSSGGVLTLSVCRRG